MQLQILMNVIIFVAYMLNLPLKKKKTIITHNAMENGAWFWHMTDARYIALPLLSRYHCLEPTNRDISRVHCTYHNKQGMAIDSWPFRNNTQHSWLFNNLFGLAQDGSDTPGNQGDEPRPIRRSVSGCVQTHSAGTEGKPKINTHTDTPAVPLWGPIKNSTQGNAAREPHHGLVNRALQKQTVVEETVAGWPVPASDENLDCSCRASQSQGRLPGYATIQKMQLKHEGQYTCRISTLSSRKVT